MAANGSRFRCPINDTTHSRNHSYPGIVLLHRLTHHLKVIKKIDMPIGARFFVLARQVLQVLSAFIRRQEAVSRADLESHSSRITPDFAKPVRSINDQCVNSTGCQSPGFFNR